MKRLIYRLRYLWVTRNLRTCWFCDGTGNEVNGVEAEIVHVGICPECDGTGWLRK